MKLSSERGQATILVLGLSMVVFGVVGIAVDGTNAFIFRRTLQTAADAAALAGAGELDGTSYYSTKGRRVSLDPNAAAATARRFLSVRGLPGHASVSVAQGRVTVVLRGAVKTSFLRIVGVTELPVAVEASSTLSAVP